ncbi:4Fe-4S dicluster domain-containing protein [Maribellus comscasis]|uniref:4Fe-4S dicluster domain-containing protein n=1 Tax=Maribellus comscasis TaxID=2681766 RepID=A0A6I6K3S0_9BACT|nr:4Fe-4S dicluster domain-containing protein [Maribellus comscasis]QGY44584.1 4Fe-4S dicluster domain-containing protein [Maribellus comscasis]
MGAKRINKSRRRFLKKSVVAGGTILATSGLKPFSVLIFAAKEPEDTLNPWYGIGIDIEKCIGCGMCAKSCKLENDVPQEPFYFRSWVEQYTIKNDGTIKVESPNGGIDGFSQSVPDNEIFKTFFVPKMCNQCAKSPCTQVCPVGATYESPEGIALVDEEYCIGCRYCIQACPYGCRYLHPEKKTVDKCTLCYHRITKGLKPACMETCPTGARIYGDLNDKDGELSLFLKKHNCQILKPHLNTGSKLYYNELSAEVR